MKRTPIRHRREKPRRTAGRAGHGLPWDEVRTIIFLRARGLCEGCGVALHTFEAHHRRTRRFGPDCPCNALALCPTCHHDRVHGTPVTARALGQILSRHSSLEPSTVPVWVHSQGRAMLLTCDGRYDTPERLASDPCDR